MVVVFRQHGHLCENGRMVVVKGKFERDEESARLYAELRSKVAPYMRYLDLGGGMGVDYDGSRTSYPSSANYTMEEYASQVVFEIGEGPRGENDRVTRLTLNADRRAFTLYNQPSNVRLLIATNLAKAGWHHLAFVYSAGEQQLRHYVDGTRQKLPKKARLEALPHGDEAYFSVGRDRLWSRPLPGRLDEAGRLIERSMVANPRSAHGAHVRVHVLYEMGEMARAFETRPARLFRRVVLPLTDPLVALRYE